MATSQDVQFGMVAESTYGTSVTPTRFLELADESLRYNKNIVQGTGLRVGSRVARSGRRVITRKDATGDTSFEVLSKGFGLLLTACFGTGVSTLVGGTTYQQLFTPTQTNTTLPSYTVQKGIPRADGTVDPYTYVGCCVDSWEFTLDTSGIAMLKVTWDCRDMATATALAVASYASGANLFHFGQSATGGMAIGGSLTVPTTTALATGSPTAVTNVRAFSLSVSNNLSRDRFNMGASGLKAHPTVGLREIKGKVSFEYTDTAIRDAFIADTEVPMVFTLTGAALSTGNETLQFAIPAAKFDGDLPNANGTDMIVTDAEFSVLDNLTAAQPLYGVIRTADSAL